MGKIEVMDVVVKPVDDTCDFVQSLGLYCWQNDRNENNATNFSSSFFL